MKTDFGIQLSRSEMKMVKGGMAENGKCYVLQSGSGNSSCWYASSGNSSTLCSRVYPNDSCIASLNNGDGSCSAGCHMN